MNAELSEMWSFPSACNATGSGAGPQRRPLTATLHLSCLPRKNAPCLASGMCCASQSLTVSSFGGVVLIGTA